MPTRRVADGSATASPTTGSSGCLAHYHETAYGAGTLRRPGRAGAVYSGLNNRFGRWAGDLFRDVNDGAHGDYIGDLRKLIRGTRDLAAKLRALT